MAYTINNYDGSALITIADGTSDTTTSLTLPGANFVGYGQFLNENLVYLMENFAGTTPPTGVSQQGQLWFNKTSQTLNVYTSAGYTPVSGIQVSATRPTVSTAGSLWFDTVNDQLNIFDGTNWNLVGPRYTKSQGVSGAIPVTIGDASQVNLTHSVVQIQYGSTVIAIFSEDAQFVPSPAISGFPVVNPGFTINNTISPPVMTTYSSTQLKSGSVTATAGAIAYDSTANAPVFYNGTNWCYFSTGNSI